MVDVTDGADVHVRLGPLELRLATCVLLDCYLCRVVYSGWLSFVVFAPRASPGGDDYSPVAFAMISFDTFAGTSAYESNTME